jgi:outer membrane protein assembly factor BamB
MKTRILVLLTATLLPCPWLAADSWPQFRGPERTGRSAEKGLLQEWPKGGPSLLWTFAEAGIGFSSPAIVGDKLYIAGAHGDDSFVICLNVASGKEAWRHKLGPIFTFQNNTWGDGPRSTPTVDGSLLYALGGFGDLVCLEAAGGKEVWRKHLAKDLDGEMMTVWGYSESPLVDGDKLVCQPGGPQGTLAALDKKTGKVLWRSKELKDKATYASLRVAEIGGVRQYIALTYISDAEGSAVAGVAADDGRLLWYQPFQKGSSYAVVPTPIIQGNLVYVTAGYGAGCRLLNVNAGGGGKFQVKDLYSRKTWKNMKNTHGGVVLVDDNVYGHSERLGWVCQELKTGRIAWEDAGKLECESGAIIYGDGRLYLYSDQGVAVLLKASAKGWEEAGRFELPMKSKAPENRPTSQRAGIWTHPAIADGRLYLRDQELLFCYDIRANK